MAYKGKAKIQKGPTIKLRHNTVLIKLKDRHFSLEQKARDFNGGLLAFTWAAFQCDRDQIFDPVTSGIQDEWQEEQSPYFGNSDVVLNNTIFSYACPIGEKGSANIFDFLPGYISNKLVSSNDGSIKLRQALFDMEIDPVVNYVSPGGREIILKANQDRLMIWMR